MTKNEHILISLGAAIAGLVLCGFAVVTKLESPIPTICVVSGLVFSVGGFISLIMALKRPSTKK